MADNDNVEEELSESPEGEEQESSEEEKEQEKKPKQTFQERINEIYGKWKDSERKYTELEDRLKQRDQDLDALKKHNQELSQSIGGIEDDIATSKRPDPLTEPEAYDAWILEKFERKQKNQNQEPPRIPEKSANIDNIRAMEEQEAEFHSDYWTVIEEVKKDMDNDTALKNKILGSKNPARKAYSYYLEKRDRQEKQRESDLRRAGVESGGPGGGKEDIVLLNEDEKRMAQVLEVDPKAYLKQREHIRKSKRY